MFKEYEIKTKMEQAQWLQLEMLFLMTNWKLLFSEGELTLVGGSGESNGGIFPDGWGGLSKFSSSGGDVAP